MNHENQYLFWKCSRLIVNMKHKRVEISIIGRKSSENDQIEDGSEWFWELKITVVMRSLPKNFYPGRDRTRVNGLIAPATTVSIE